ncbi:MAG: glutathione S-transferase, partial [Rubrivivax sp.]
MPVATATRKTVARKTARAAAPTATLTLSSKNYSSWSLRG